MLLRVEMEGLAQVDVATFHRVMAEGEKLEQIGAFQKAIVAYTTVRMDFDLRISPTRHWEQFPRMVPWRTLWAAFACVLAPDVICKSEITSLL